MHHRPTRPSTLSRPTWLGLGLVLVCVVVLLPQVALANTIQNLLWTIVSTVFGFMVYLGGTFMNIGINTFVVGFGKLYLESGLGHTVDQLWAIVRDIFNLTFIFGLVLIGLKMIFNSSDSTAKQMLGMLIMAALLVNFSLFFAKTIVDFSNLTAYQLVDTFKPANSGEPANVSGSFMQSVGLMKAWEWREVPKGATYTYIFMMMILFIIMAFVFFAGGLLLLIRFAVLNIYLILSPLMFLGWVLPGASKLTSDYWRGFIGRAFFAPAYILMLYFSYRVINGFKVTSEGAPKNEAAFAALFTEKTSAGIEQLLAVFGLTSIFLVASIIVAQKMGSVGGNAAVGAGRWLQRKGVGMMKVGAGAATAGSLAYLGRNTLGRSANAMANNDDLKRRAATSWTAKQQLKLAQWGSKKSFDARQVAGVGSAMGVGTGATGGFAGTVEKKRKAQEEFAKSLGEVDTKTKEGKEAVKTKLEEIKNDPESDYNQQKVARDTIATVKQAADAALKAKQNQVAAETKPLQDEIDKLRNLLQSNNLSDVQRANMLREVNDKEQRLATVKATHSAELDNLGQVADQAGKDLRKAEGALEKALNAAKSEAEAAVKYSRQTTYLKTEAERAERLRSTGMVARAAVAGGALGLATGGLAYAGLPVLLGALAGSSLALSSAGSDALAIEAAKKKYGKNGKKMAELENQKKQVDLFRARNKEFGLDDDTSKDTDNKKE